MWVRFEKLHWHRFSGMVRRRFLPGDVKNLPKAVAEVAVASGAAVKVKTPKRGEKPGGDDGA